MIKIFCDLQISRTQQVKLLEPESAAVGTVDTTVDINRFQVETMEVDEVKPVIAAEQAAEKSDLYNFLILVSVSYRSVSKIDLYISLTFNLFL